MASSVAGFELVPVDSVLPHPQNARHGDVGAIADSLRHHGQFRPIVVQKSTRRVLAGNHTWKAAKALGWEQIEVAWVDVDDDQALRILLVDNRTNDLASYDEPLLADLLAEVARSDAGLVGSGFDGDALDELIGAVLPAPDGDERYTPEWVFEAMEVEFDVDLAAPEGGIPYIPAKSYFTARDDALSKPWSDLFVWCNPPYSIGAQFGRKWNAEVSEGVWLGPQTNSTYRVELMRKAKALFLPDHLGFHRGDISEEPGGIRYPVFLAGFGERGGQAIANLHRNAPDHGCGARVMKR